MGLSPLSLLCLLVLPSSVFSRMIPVIQTNEVQDPLPSSRTVIHLWNSSSHLVDQSFGATWAFTINAHGAERLEIDFAVANLTEDTPCISCSALRISFRFDEGHIVLNSRRNGKWDFEERSRSPVEREEQFNLKVKLVNDGFEISINSYWMAKFFSRLRSSQISEVRSFGGSDSQVELRYSEEEAPEGSQDVVGQFHKSKRALNEYEILLDQYRNSYKSMLTQFNELVSERTEETHDDSGKEQEEVDENRVTDGENTDTDGDEQTDESGDQVTNENDYQQEETDEHQGHHDYEDENQNHDEEPDQEQETGQTEEEYSSGDSETEESNDYQNQPETNNEDGTEDEETSHEEYQESGEEEEGSHEIEDEQEEEKSLDILEQEYRDAMKRYMNAKLKHALDRMVI